MRKGVNKDKPKGTAYSKMKALRKKKRINAEARKERQAKLEKIEEAKKAILTGYKKGYILVEIEGEIEKRKPVFPKVKLTKVNYKSHLGDIEIKLCGNYIKLRELNGFKSMVKELAFEIEGTL